MPEIADDLSCSLTQDQSRDPAKETKHDQPFKDDVNKPYIDCLEPGS